MIPVLVTRPQPAADETGARLAAIGFAPTLFPLLRFTPLVFSAPPVAGLSGVIATSANAVRALVARGLGPQLAGLPLYAVGERTAAAGRAAGFSRIVSAGGTAGDLIDLLAARRPEGVLFYPHGRQVSHDLEVALAPHGVKILPEPVYEMAAAESFPDEVAARLSGGRFAAAFLYSRRTAGLFSALSAKLPQSGWQKEIVLMCLSQNVADGADRTVFSRIALANAPSEDGMMALALAFAQGQNIMRSPASEPRE